VVDENNNVIKKAEITVNDIATKTVYGVYKTNEQTGKMVIISEPNKEYQIVIKAVGYEPYVTNIILTSDNELSYRLTNHMR
ncbi:MAG: carboxypeptidase-like regulatory domain-containing protein, partial [Bacteroidia bacterium]